MEMPIIASRDPSCLDRFKYIYRFDVSINQSIIQQFLDCNIRTFRFSKIVPGTKDLLKIQKTGQFQADIVVDGLTATVYFVAADDTTLMTSLELFGRRLHEAGYGQITYSTLQSSQCGRCPARHLKKCLA